RWRALGHRILIEQSAQQILRDGVHFEQAACYHRYTIEIYLHFLLLAGRYGVDIPVDVVARVSKMLDFLACIVGDDGAGPRLGDVDGGWVLPLADRRAQDCRGIFAIAAVILRRDDLAALALGDASEVAWLLGASGLAEFARLEESGAPTSVRRSVIFPAGGYA